MVDIGFQPKNLYNSGFSLNKKLPSPMINANRIATDPSVGADFLNWKPQEMDISLAGGDMNLGGGAGGGMFDGIDWGGAMEGFANFGSGLTSLAGAYNAYKQLGMMEDQFNFAKSAHNQNVANQAAITNDQLRKQRSAAARQLGYKDDSQEFKDYVSAGAQVSGAPIG